MGSLLHNNVCYNHCGRFIIFRAPQGFSESKVHFKVLNCFLLFFAQDNERQAMCIAQYIRWLIHYQSFLLYSNCQYGQTISTLDCRWLTEWRIQLPALFPVLAVQSIINPAISCNFPVSVQLYIPSTSDDSTVNAVLCNTVQLSTVKFYTVQCSTV